MTAEMRQYLRTQVDLARRALLARPERVRFCSTCFEPFDAGRKSCECTRSAVRVKTTARKVYEREYKRRWRAAQRGTPARAGRAA